MCIANIYNPTQEEDGNAAKIWELLRRNPQFRAKSSQLIELYKHETQRKDLLSYFQQLDQDNPLSAFVLRWLFKPNSVCFFRPRPVEDSHGIWTANDMVTSGFDLEETQIIQFEALISAEEAETCYAGPLTISTGPFSLDTPWRETPDLFQFCFTWLWKPYELGTLPDLFPITMEGIFLKGKVDPRAIDWTFLDSSEPQISWTTRCELMRLRNLLTNNDLFAVPRMIATHEKESLKDLFGAFIDNLPGRKNATTSDQKYQHFLGNRTDWEAFLFCFERMRSGRENMATAINKLIEFNVRNSIWSPTSDFFNIVKARYCKVESLMNAVFPVFNFVQLIEIGLNLPQSPIIIHNAQLAKTICTQYLQAIHVFAHSMK